MRSSWRSSAGSFQFASQVASGSNFTARCGFKGICSADLLGPDADCPNRPRHLVFGFQRSRCALDSVPGLVAICQKCSRPVRCDDVADVDCKQFPQAHHQPAIALLSHASDTLCARTVLEGHHFLQSCQSRQSHSECRSASHASTTSLSYERISTSSVRPSLTCTPTLPSRL